ncbi:ABC transporter ATP-binding protein [Geobacter sp. SVR]|uniref:ABC transporter ATP-binding protein n=1 Tax=Geobacter sp. SVR TaxID=2495594 RepID=UPI00143EFD51|nr:ABC transporter ATP-binding protein [Geobacter sp. SVR]BCS53780.1 dipeptide/oligopeptide/nickel ABC transporter ATP-binding protein [Geobacter sp. SVR]GCF85711.1 dipeptide/oligopeptide/nickel ABC transporter ATP-binding protein [Geobacter sp. SVR]
MSLLSIDNLHTCFRTAAGPLPAVNGVSFSIEKGETVALVGESGSGKSMTALSVMRLVPPPGFIRSGSITFDGCDLLSLADQDMRSIRGSRISMVFQEPMTSLNPVLRIGDQLTEPLRLHRALNRTKAAEKATELLQVVGIPAAGDRMRDYPHQLSGGMRQRVMIAMALACDPALLIADEPTTALDVTIQAQILELIDSLRRSVDMGILLITHDLGIVAERSDRTCVMYAGRIVESAPSAELLRHPGHPYTRALLASLPQNAEPGKPLATLAGQPPGITAASRGCGFCDRCPVSLPECRQELPELREISPGHHVRCWNLP